MTAVAMSESAPGKINLCLFLGRLREDGRHELVTLFESVSLYDELVMRMSPDGRDRVICAGVEGPNLVAEALAGLRARDWRAPPVTVEITKRIPVAAGMGGGSADAAAFLRLADRLSPTAPAHLSALAAELGADVPSQLGPGLVLGTGAGDGVEPRPPLAAHALAIVPLPEQLATAAVYAEADRLGLARGDDELEARRHELEPWLEPGGRLPDHLVVNDLEPAARSLCPRIDEALQAVRATGADQALVCGSGPTVAGVWWGEDGRGRAAAAAGALRGRFPGARHVLPVSSRGSGKIPSR